jgi:hypothetical protein
MAGGCHGHHGPMPKPAHSCCYAEHQAPAAVLTAPVPVATPSVIAWISTSDTDTPQAGAILNVEARDSSPPLFTVLRI